MVESQNLPAREASCAPLAAEIMGLNEMSALQGRFEKYALLFVSNVNTVPISQFAGCCIKWGVCVCVKSNGDALRLSLDQTGLGETSSVTHQQCQRGHDLNHSSGKRG